jgi:hypothetical protein
MFDVYPNDSESSVEFPLYSRGNYGEAFPNPLTPMTGSLIQAATKRGQQHFAIRSGMMTARDLVDPRNAVSGQFWGYQYGNVSIARRAAVRIPGVKVSDIDEQFAGVGILPPYIPSKGDRNFRATIRLLRLLTVHSVTMLQSRRRKCGKKSMNGERRSHHQIRPAKRNFSIAFDRSVGGASNSSST